MRLMVFFGLILLSGCSQKTNVGEVSTDFSGVKVTEQSFSTDPSKDWPQWRGVSGNGHAVGSAPREWSSSQNILWCADVPGRGHSSPVIVRDLVFLATALDEEEKQLVLAYDRKTGEKKWEQVLGQGGFPGSGQLHNKSTNANGTVACDGERVYIGFLNHQEIHAAALDLSGNLVWKEKLGGFNSKFGYAPSPSFYKSVVIFACDNQGGGYISAHDRATGKTAWRKKRPAVSTYSSPAIATVAGKDQLLISGCGLVSSYDPATGNELWSCSGTTAATCGTMVWNDQNVFASGGYPGSQTLCVSGDGSKRVVWQNSNKAYEPSMILVEGHIYLVSDQGIVNCFNAESGEVAWTKRLSGQFSASPIVAEGVIYATSDSGMTYLFEASPGGYKSVGECQLGDDAFASPAVAQGELFLRVGVDSGSGRQEKLYCIGKR